MKITKRQLRRIIREEKARLLREGPLPGQFTDDDRDDTRMMSDKTASAIQMLQTVHANLEDLRYNVDQGPSQEIDRQLVLLEDAIHALGGVV